jgi:hypothetical protein
MSEYPPRHLAIYPYAKVRTNFSRSHWRVFAAAMNAVLLRHAGPPARRHAACIFPLSGGLNEGVCRRYAQGRQRTGICTAAYIGKA